MKRWSLKKSAPLSVQQFVDKCFGDDLEFVMRFHNIRGDTDLEVGAWSPAPAAAIEPENRAKPNERQDVRQLSSRAPLLAPAVVQRNLGDMDNAVFRVDQLRAVEEMDDGSLASVRVEQCIQLDGLPLEGTYTVRTVTTATPDAHDNASAADGHATRALIITVEGEVECNHGASVPGLKGVIEGILYYQSREASVLFLDMVTLSGAVSTTPEDAHGLQSTQHHTSDTDGGEFAHDNAATSDDGDDTSRASSELSWDSARSWISNSQHTEAMSTNGLREQLAFLAQLKEDGLLHEEALIAQQRVLLKKFHKSIRSPASGSFASEFASDDFYSQAQLMEGSPIQTCSSTTRGELDLESGHDSRHTTMDILGVTFGKHAKRGITSWFIFAGVLHFALDGIFVIFGNTENMSSGWMEPWRVYAQEDERYSRRSRLINAVQILGAFVHGPLCFVAGWGVYKQTNWYPIVAVLVSFCELYNRVILISTFDSLSTKLGNPSPQFLFAFVTWNLLWIVIPAVLLFFLVKTLLVSGQIQMDEERRDRYRHSGRAQRAHASRSMRKHRP